MWMTVIERKDMLGSMDGGGGAVCCDFRLKDTGKNL